MKTNEELAQEWRKKHLREFEGYGGEFNYDPPDLDGAILAAYKAGYAQALKDTPKEGKE